MRITESMLYEFKPFACFGIGVGSALVAPQTIVFGIMLVWAGWMILKMRWDRRAKTRS